MRSPDYVSPFVTLYNNDCLTVLQDLPDDSVDSVVTDPPYGIAMMERDWDNQGTAFNQAVWQEVYRVLKPGGHLCSFGGTRTYHRMVVAVEDAGFEIRDSLIWIRGGQTLPKNYGVGRAIKRMGEGDDWLGWGTALKPSHETIVLARKPISEQTIAHNVLRWGTGGLNIDATRLSTTDEIGRNNINGPWSKGLTMHKSGIPGQDARGKDSGGRWPTNALFSHQPDCKIIGQVSEDGYVINRWTDAAFPFGGAAGQQYDSFTVDKSTRLVYECAPGCTVYLLDAQTGPLKAGRAGKNSRSWGVGGQQQVKEWKADGSEAYDQDGPPTGASRFFPAFPFSEDDFVPFLYVSKANKRERNAGLPEGSENNHPTVKPLKLMRWLCRLVTPPEGTILDPFAGSGSTGVAAIEEGFRVILVENDLTEGYIDLIKARTKHAEQYVTADDRETEPA